MVGPGHLLFFSSEHQRSNVFISSAKLIIANTRTYQRDHCWTLSSVPVPWPGPANLNLMTLGGVLYSRVPSKALCLPHIKFAIMVRWQNFNGLDDTLFFSPSQVKTEELARLQSQLPKLVG
jgi:hypothetical protein